MTNTDRAMELLELRDALQDWLAGHGCNPSDESMDDLLEIIRTECRHAEIAVAEALTAPVSEEMVERVAEAIERADSEPCPDYPDFPDNPKISDWGIHLARAAIEAMRSFSSTSA